MGLHKFTTVDEYINFAPAEHQQTLNALRNTLKNAIPEAEEVISYNMPAYKYKHILVYFALSKNHIGFYPTPVGIEAFKDRLEDYKYAKGSVQFPLNQPLPLGLIAEMAKFRYKKELSDQ